MRLSLLALLVVAARTRADDTEDITNREVADVDYYDQRDHDMVVNRAFGPDAYGGNTETDESGRNEAVEEASWKLQVPFRVRLSGNKHLPSNDQRYKRSISKRSLVVPVNSRNGRAIASGGGYFDSSRTRISHIPSMQQSGPIVQSALRYQPSREETPAPVNLAMPAGRVVSSLDHHQLPHDQSNHDQSDQGEEETASVDSPRFEFNYDIPKDSFQRDVVNGQFSTFAKLPNNFESLIQSDNSFLDALTEYPHTDSESRHNESIASYNGPYTHSLSGTSGSGNFPDYDYDQLRPHQSHHLQRTSSSQQSSRLAPHYLPLHQYRRSSSSSDGQFMRRSGSGSSSKFLRPEQLDEDEFAGEKKESGAWSQYWPTTTTTPAPPPTGNKEIVAHVRVMKNGVIDQNIRRHGEILVRYNAEPMSPPPPPPPPGYAPPATTTTPAPISYYQPYTTTTTTTPPPPIYQVIYPVPPKTTTTTPAPVPYGPYAPPPPAPTTASPATSIYGNLPPSQIPKVIYAIMMMDKMQAAASASPSSSRDGTKHPVLFLT